jgi:hypothetical protein
VLGLELQCKGKDNSVRVRITVLGLELQCKCKDNSVRDRVTVRIRVEDDG